MPKIQFIGLIALPIILLVLPANYFDSGESMCLSVLLLDTTCLGCGITRAVQHFIHFEFKQALEFNRLVVIVLPLLVFLWYKEVRRIFLKIKESYL